MGYAEKITGVNFGSNAIAGRIISDRRKLVGEYILGVDKPTSITNWANPALPLTEQGTPTYNADHVIVRSHASAGFGFDTGIIPAENRTLIVIRKNATTATSVSIVGHGQSASFSMNQVSTDNYMGNGEASQAGSANRTRPASGSDIYFEAAVRVPRANSAAGFGKGYYVNAGFVTELTASAATNVSRQNRTVWIGGTSLTDSITTNNLPVYAVWLLDRPCSLAELQDIYDKAAAWYLAEKGLTIV